MPWPRGFTLYDKDISCRLSSACGTGNGWSNEPFGHVNPGAKAAACIDMLIQTLVCDDAVVFTVANHSLGPHRFEIPVGTRQKGFGGNWRQQRNREGVCARCKRAVKDRSAFVDTKFARQAAS